MRKFVPYILHEPRAPLSRAVFSSPHSGRRYFPEFVARARLSALDLRASEDAFVDELFATAPEFGAPLIVAEAPRAYVDLNREPGDLDPALIEGVPGVGLNARSAVGLGVVPRVVAEGREIYEGKIPMDDARARIERFHAPYHDALGALMDIAVSRRGVALLFDCHSMPSEALRSAPRIRGRRADVVLGDRFGASAAPWAMALVERAFVDAGFAVSRNAPFAGGWITQRYGRPQRGRHAVQIEIDRGLYLDEARVEKRHDFDACVAALKPVIAALAEDSTAVAASLAAE